MIWAATFTIFGLLVIIGIVDTPGGVIAATGTGILFLTLIHFL